MSGRGTGKRWTPDEVRALTDHYPDHGRRWSGWAERLPGRTERQIYNKAYRMGIRGPSRDWTRKEDAEIDMLLGMLEERMHRPRSAIASHMYLVTRGKAGEQWRR